MEEVNLETFDLLYSLSIALFYYFPAVNMVKWFCSSSLCYNNFRTVDKEGNPIKFYRLPRDSSIQGKYKNILKTDGMNWMNGHICCEHWSSGVRTNANDIPDVTVPPTQLSIIVSKYEKFKVVF